MEGVLKDLIKKRSIIKGRLTKFKDYVNTLKQVGSTKITAVQIKDLSMRVDKFQELLTEFSALQTEIELLSTNIDEQITERDALESQFFSLLSVSQDLIENCSSNKILQENESVVGSCSHSPFNSIKLPTINLAKFDGNYLKWLEFRDTFDSLINDNESIRLINKFHYLRSSLEGGAAVVIRSIEFTANNYKNAWQLLCDRYNNKNILINNHLKSLMSVEPMTKESFKALRFMIDHISKNLRSLQALGLPTDQWDILLIFIMSAKLDSITSRKWEEYKNNLKELPTLDDFYSFLRNRADILETTHYNRSEKHEQRPHFNNRTVRSFVTSSEESTKRYQLCVLCNQPHLVYECPKFKEMDIDDRAREVSKFKLCSICLRSGHNTYQCRLKGSCRICKGKHNTLLHRQPATALLLEQVAPSASTAPGPVALSAVTMTHTLLCTARVQLVNEENNCTVMARALLDTGSQSSFLSEDICNKLGLRKDCNKRLSVCGLNNIKCDISGSCDVKIKSCLSSFSAQVSCLLVPTITGTLPGFEINTQQLNIPDNIELADPNFFQPSSIDILLGSDIFWSIIETNQIKLGSNMPTLQESKLGWLIAGPIGIHTQPKKKVYCNFSLVDLDRTIKKFWQVEELPSDEKTLSLEEQFCESNFVETTTRLEDGRFCVKMPLKEPETVLGDSFYLAKKRFANLENKLNKDPQLKESYSAFINEYENLGHLSEVERPESGNYLPHHSVTRHKSETTKLRVVFHASAKTSSGKSLNDIQAVGPVIQSDLMSILLRFRGHRFVLLGDIEKMYRQIALHPSQRHLQLILWKDYSPIDNEDQASSEIKTLQLNTVTYGTASAPFISTRCILQLANECSDDTIATVIKNDFYIDDLNTGAETESELQYIYKNVNSVLRAACLPLRKIRTNCSQAFTNEETITDIVDLTKESSVLGLSYCPKNDMIQFSANIEPASQHTKRSVISTTCKIFDPLGLISAVVITAKIFLQKLWVEKLTWDEPIPKRFLGVWLCFINNLHLISKIKITRNVMCDAPILKDLHCFVDASQAAYGACVYIRSVNESNEVTVRLLCAKARVCPLGCTTIPRKELLGALLGARLCAKVIKSFRFEIANKTIWTDSTVVLGWLKTDVKNLKPFVCNRVNEINELAVGFQLRHVPTSMNPADLASRGVDPQNIASSSLWWEGPAFLKKGEDGWPQGSCAPEELPEIKVPAPSFTGLVNATESFIDLSRYSNLTRVIRIFAFVLRFVNNCKKEKQKLSGPLILTELNDSHTILIKCCQLESFSTEIKDLEKGKSVNIKSKLLNLTPFIDADGIVRVGGRLNNSSYNFEKAHHIILDSKQNLCKLIMIHEHMRLFHAGPQLTLASVRDRYWPIGGRHLARNIVKQCVTCIRLRATTVQPIMGHLPEARTAAGFAFNSVGVDFAGPFLIASRKGRGSRTTKCYLCLFVCLSTKAVHLELVSDLSTQAFILCLRRFLARRGYPYEIYCDNGRNFVGANNELGRALRSSRRSVFEYSTGEGIKFVFSPAYSPHFGGIFEAGIKSAKHHLKRVAGNAALTFEELATLFTRKELVYSTEIIGK